MRSPSGVLAHHLPNGSARGPDVRGYRLLNEGSRVRIPPRVRTRSSAVEHWGASPVLGHYLPASTASSHLSKEHDHEHARTHLPRPRRGYAADASASRPHASARRQWRLRLPARPLGAARPLPDPRIRRRNVLRHGAAAHQGERGQPRRGGSRGRRTRRRARHRARRERPRAQGAAGDLRARGVRRLRRRRHARARAERGPAARVPHGLAPADVLLVHRAVPRLGPWPAQGPARLVRIQAGARARVPGAQVPEP